MVFYGLMVTFLTVVKYAYNEPAVHSALQAIYRGGIVFSEHYSSE
jgi:hypothetical protein